MRVAPLELGDLAEPIVPTPWELVEPPAPGLLSRVFCGKQYEKRREASRRRYEAYVADVERKERGRQERVTELRRAHAEELRRQTAEVRQHNEEIERLRHGVPERDKDAVETFLRHVLDATAGRVSA